MKLSEQLKRGRIDRPDEWTMDRYIRKATEIESAICDLVAITEELAQKRKEAEMLRYALEKYRGQIDNEGKHSAVDALSANIANK